MCVLFWLKPFELKLARARKGRLGSFLPLLLLALIRFSTGLCWVFPAAYVETVPPMRLVAKRLKVLLGLCLSGQTEIYASLSQEPALSHRSSEPCSVSRKVDAGQSVCAQSTASENRKRCATGAFSGHLVPNPFAQGVKPTSHMQCECYRDSGHL